MLKLTYTDDRFNIEVLVEYLENWVSTRLLLGLRTGRIIFVKPDYASFIIRTDLVQWNKLKNLINNGEHNKINFSTYNDNHLEVILQGFWATSDPDPQSCDGIFITEMDYEVEYVLYQLCLETNYKIGMMIE